jgi:hypothetical protein
MTEATDLLERLRAVVVPRLRECEQSLREKFPSVDVSFYEGEVGQLTDYRGYHLGLECVLAEAAPEAPSCLALEISVRGKDTSPELDAADVAWGHPDGRVLADLLHQPVPLTKEQIETLAARIPELCAAMDQALLACVPPSG